MKTFVFTILCLLSVVAVNAQSVDRTSEFLLDNYTQGTVLFKNKTTAKAPFNYDMLKSQMMFKDGENEMILQELHTIDTLYIGERKFIPYKNCFLEKLDAGSQVLFVDWKVAITNTLKQEGMGLISLGGGSEAINVSRTQTEATSVTRNIDVAFKSNNSYYLQSGKKMQLFNTVPGFIKLYPKIYSKDIQNFVTDKKINIQIIEQLNSLITFADNLTQ